MHQITVIILFESVALFLANKVTRLKLYSNRKKKMKHTSLGDIRLVNFVMAYGLLLLLRHVQ